MIIGWRGEDGFIDEPQHQLQGEITKELLTLLNIKFYELSNKTSDDEFNTILKKISLRLEKLERVAILVRKNAFQDSKTSLLNFESNYILSREESLEILLKNIGSKAPIVSTTGKTSRELYEICKKNNLNIDRIFLTVGSMGHASMIALGVAINKPKKIIYLVDGDGAALMHLGNLSLIGDQCPKNLVHILLNNHSHESVGGMPVSGMNINFKYLASSLGYKHSYEAFNKDEFTQILNSVTFDGPYFINLEINKLSRKNLSRPSESPQANKLKFMEAIK
jgi:phosphonopyruvate decarboxylase